MALFQTSVLKKYLKVKDKEAKKVEAQTLKAEIDKADREIDQMVYELSKEGIKIVEGSNN